MSQMSFGAGGELIPVRVEIQVDTSKAELSLGKLMTAAYGVIGLLRHMGLPEEADALLMKVQRITSSLYMMQAALLAVQASTGPYGLLFAMFVATGTAVTVADTFYETTRGI